MRLRSKAGRLAVAELGCSLLLLAAGLGLGLGSTLDSLSLALEFLGQFTRGSSFLLYDFVLLKYIVNKIAKKRRRTNAPFEQSRSLGCPLAPREMLFPSKIVADSLTLARLTLLSYFFLASISS
jgi:hypothetical protein